MPAYAKKPQLKTSLAPYAPRAALSSVTAAIATSRMKHQIQMGPFISSTQIKPTLANNIPNDVYCEACIVSY